MFSINPVAIPIIGTVDTLTVSVNPFQIDTEAPYAVQVYYSLSGANAFYQNNMTIPAEVVSQWGADDTVILNYVMAQLNVSLAPVTP